MGDKQTDRVGIDVGKDLTEAVTLVACQLSRLVEQRHREFDWFRVHVDLATKADLREVEKRIIAAIEKGGRGGLSKEDEAALAELLASGERFAKRLEALDAKTPAVT